jgi:tetratricopeptide (TPR) repeat protein
MSRRLIAAFLAVLGIYTISTSLWADTADDFYREANTFFTNKDYQRAFDAYQGAIPYDTDAYRAYLGMGNCEYYLNDRVKAVEYLQKSDDLHKDEKVEAFIAKVKSSIPAPKTPLFIKAENLLKDKKYKEAIPLLKEVEQYEATNLKAFYDMGYCFYALGDKEQATLNFSYYENKTNDSAVTALVAKMQGQLTVDDREWIDGQIQLGPPFSQPFRYSGIGIRFEPTFQFTSLKDFNNAVSAMTQTANKSSQDSSFTFTAQAAPGGLGIDLNPYLQVSQDLEIGLTVGTLFIGQMTASFTDPNSLSDPEADGSISYSVIEAGISLRYELIRLYKDKIKLFIDVNPSMYLTSLSTANSEVTTPTPNTGFDFPLVTGNFSSSGFGGRLKLGVDWKPIPNSIISGFLGYQLAQIQGFTGSGIASGGYSGVPNGGQVNMPGQLMTQQGPNGTRIIFVPSSATVSGASPLTLDLSGIIIGADMTILL